MVCEKDIAPPCGDCGGRKPGSQYTEVVMEWSNGSKMPIAVCLNCATSHEWCKPEVKAAITLAHQDHWAELGGRFDKAVVIV